MLVLQCQTSWKIFGNFIELLFLAACSDGWPYRQKSSDWRHKTNSTLPLLSNSSLWITSQFLFKIFCTYVHNKLKSTRSIISIKIKTIIFFWETEIYFSFWYTLKRTDVQKELKFKLHTLLLISVTGLHK